MREVEVSRLTDVIEKLCIEANEHLPEDVKCAITGCRACEDGEIAKGVLDKIVENYEIADAQNVPICQDTGMACVFLEIGQDVHIAGGDLAEAVNEGVRRGYDKGYLRKIRCQRSGQKRKHRRQYTGYDLYRDRSWRSGESNCRTKRLRKREYEPDPYVQAICRPSGNQGFHS